MPRAKSSTKAEKTPETRIEGNEESPGAMTLAEPADAATEALATTVARDSRGIPKDWVPPAERDRSEGIPGPNNTTNHGTEVAPTTLDGWAELGVIGDVRAGNWYEVPDAREKPEPIRVLKVLQLPDKPKFRTFARLEVERIDGVQFTWDVTAWRAWCAIRGVNQPKEWFTIQSKGTGTEKRFRAAQGTAPPEGPWA